MYCPHCGNKISDDTSICNICGFNVKKYLKDNGVQLKNLTAKTKQKSKERVSQGQVYKSKSRKAPKVILGVIAGLAAVLTVFVLVGVFVFDVNPKEVIADVMPGDKAKPGYNLTGFKMDSASQYFDDTLYADLGDESHIAVDPDTYVSYYDNEIIFRVNDNVTERDVVKRVIDKYDAKIVGKSEFVGTYLIRFNNQIYNYDELLKIRSEMENNSLVSSVYLNYAMEIGEDDSSSMYEPSGTVWDNTYTEIPSGKNWGIEAIRAPQAWEYYDLMEDVNVGVYECSGFQSNHGDLVNIVQNQNYENEGKHGTHVTGIIAAEFDNGIGINGVCPTARISYIDTASSEQLAGNDDYDNKVFKTNGFLDSLAMVYLIHYQNCKIINHSRRNINYIAVYVASGYGDNEENTQKARDNIDMMASLIADTLSVLLEKNDDFVICQSAGNIEMNFMAVKDDTNTYGYREYDSIKNNENFIDNIKYLFKHGDVLSMDATYNSAFAAITDKKLKDRIIVVGNVKDDGDDTYDLADDTFTGGRVDIVAPGVDIESTIPDQTYDVDSGTSMSTPHVSGIAAMLYAINPSLKGDQVKKIICDSARNPSHTRKIEEYYLANAEAAIKALINDKEYEDKVKYTYSSKVVDDKGNPIEGAKVTATKILKSENELELQTVTTAADGSFTIKSLAGNGYISIEKSGYESLDGNSSVKIQQNFEKGANYTETSIVMKKPNPYEKKIAEFADQYGYANGGDFEKIVDSSSISGNTEIWKDRSGVVGYDIVDMNNDGADELLIYVMIHENKTSDRNSLYCYSFTIDSSDQIVSNGEFCLYTMNLNDTNTGYCVVGIMNKNDKKALYCEYAIMGGAELQNYSITLFSISDAGYDVPQLEKNYCLSGTNYISLTAETYYNDKSENIREIWNFTKNKYGESGNLVKAELHSQGLPNNEKTVAETIKSIGCSDGEEPQAFPIPDYPSYYGCDELNTSVCYSHMTVNGNFNTGKAITARSTLIFNGLHESNETWQNAYADFLSANKDELKNMTFMLGYVDENDIPELIVSEGYSRVDGTRYYTYCEGSVKLSMTSYEYGLANYVPKKNLIINSFMHMGLMGASYHELTWDGSSRELFSYSTNEASGGNDIFYKINGNDVSKEEYDSAIDNSGYSENSLNQNGEQIISNDAQCQITNRNIDTLRKTPAEFLNGKDNEIVRALFFPGEM